jgi:hypothetical protein
MREPHVMMVEISYPIEKAWQALFDEIAVKVEKVRDAMHDLTVAVHYMACDNIGRGGLSACHPPMKADVGEKDAVPNGTVDPKL